MKKKKAKRIFQEELADPAFQEPYAKAIEIVRGILEEYQEKSKAADHHRIEMISSRIKTPQSAYDKLKRKGKELTAESAKKNLNDLAGMRNIINLRKKWKGICSQVPFIVLKYRQGCI